MMRALMTSLIWRYRYVPPSRFGTLQGYPTTPSNTGQSRAPIPRPLFGIGHKRTPIRHGEDPPLLPQMRDGLPYRHLRHTILSYHHFLAGNGTVWRDLTSLDTFDNFTSDSLIYRHLPWRARNARLTDVRPLPRNRVRQPPLPQFPGDATRGRPSDAIVLLKRGLTRKNIARSKHPTVDLIADQAGDLLIERHGTRTIEHARIINISTVLTHRPTATPSPQPPQSTYTGKVAMRSGRRGHVCHQQHQRPCTSSALAPAARATGSPLGPARRLHRRRQPGDPVRCPRRQHRQSYVPSALAPQQHRGPYAVRSGDLACRSHRRASSRQPRHPVRCQRQQHRQPACRSAPAAPGAPLRR